MSDVYSTRVIDEPVSRFPSSHLPRAIAIGVVFWLAGALIIRAVGASGLAWDTRRVLLFVVTIPVMWLAIACLRRPGPDSRTRLVAMASVATGTAAFCDVIALTWFPGLYARDASTIVAGTIFLFWGIGWALAFACWHGAQTPVRPDREAKPTI
jgi:hypothetical protein